MTIPASGPVSLSQIQTEFGGTNPISIDEYYRGGANVPAISTTTTIPASGAISFDNFHNTSSTVSPPPGLTVNISPTTASGTGPSGSVTTNSVTATPTGGVGPYTYAWTRVSGDTLTINSASAATTTFSAIVSSTNLLKSGVYKCTITDHNGLVGSDTVDVDINFDSGA